MSNRLFNGLDSNSFISYISWTADDDLRKIKQRQHDKHHQDILDWITPVEYGHNQSDTIKRRQPGTGRWFLASAEYNGWLNNANQILFCPGIPGAGKTVLTSIVIEDLYNRFENEAAVGIAYIYFSFREKDKQDPCHLLASILKQLSQSPLPDSVQQLHDKHKPRRTRPSLDEFSTAVRLVAKSYSQVFLVFDALDECQTSSGYRSKFLQEVFRIHKDLGLNILTTSRPIPDIVSEFSDAISINIRANKDDVDMYVQGHLEQLPSFIHRDTELQAEIIDVISKAVDGMYVFFLFSNTYTKTQPDTNIHPGFYWRNYISVSSMTS